MAVTVVKRMAIVEESTALNAEFRAGRWVYHRLLDFELQHQEMLDAFAPRLTRVGRLIAKLARRKRWREKTHGWKPPLKPELLEALEIERDRLRDERNANPKWKTLLAWPREKMEPKKCRRKSGESDEELEKRQAAAGRSRREVHAISVYKQRRCYWGTYNAQKASVDQAVQTVIKERTKGNAAELRRPRWRDPQRITTGPGGCKVLDYGKTTMLVRLRLNDGWVDVRTSGRSGLPVLPDDAEVRVAELCRVRIGDAWRYSLSLTYRGSFGRCARGGGVVGIDTGHRRFGDSLRAFVWYGNDGKRGEVRLPAECWRQLERARKTQSLIDEQFSHQPTSARSRFSYRGELMRSGVRTEEQQAWLSWERAREREILSAKKRARNLRDNAYIVAVRKLANRYSAMAIDTVGGSVQKVQKDNSLPSEIKMARDLVAAYHLQTIFERFGVAKLPVTARNSTKECPLCKKLHDVGSKQMMRCPNTGIEHDQDFSAAYTMMVRGVTARKAADRAAKENAA